MSNFLHDHYLSKGFSDQADIEFFLNLSAQFFLVRFILLPFAIGETKHILTCCPGTQNLSIPDTNPGNKINKRTFHC